LRVLAQVLDNGVEFDFLDVNPPVGSGGGWR
jgi:hypothetical protein